MILQSRLYCILVYGICSFGISCIGGGGLQYGGQISSLRIMSSLLSSNGGGNINDSCSISFCVNTFSDNVDIPTNMTKARNEANTITFKSEIILSFVYRIIKYLSFQIKNFYICNTTIGCMNQQKVDQLAERIINETNSAISCLTLYLGHKLDLFNSLKETCPVTSTELAAKTKYSERYLREWLECMTVNGYIEYDPSTNKFSISEEHALVFCDRDNSAYAIPFVYWIPSLSSAMEKLLEAFKIGKGVSYSSYGIDLLFAQGEGNRPMFVNDIAKWISSMPDIENKLKSEGGRVLDVGCGDGWASISLAKYFPLVKIDAIDPDSSSIDNASKNVLDEGLEERISLYTTPIEKAPVKEKYDLIMTFESIHDMAYPIEALRKMKEMVSTNGTVLVGDVKMKDKLQDKNDFAGRLYYNFSVLLCLPQSMAYTNSEATGAAMTPSTFKRFVKEAGFSKVDTLPIEHFIWKFYRLYQ